MGKRKRSQQEGVLTDGAQKKSKASNNQSKETPSSSVVVPGPDGAQDTGISNVTESRKRSRRGSRKGSKKARKPDDGQLISKSTSTPHGKTKDESTTSVRRIDTHGHVSNVLGGALSDLDPIFTIDQQSLLLSYQSCVKVYTLSSSSLSRVLKPASKGSISGMVLSPLNPSLLYISLSSGGIEEWDWTSATRNRAWDIKSSIMALAVASCEVAGTLVETIYTVDTNSERKKWRITGHRLREGADTELQTLYRSLAPLAHLQVLNDGCTIIASADQNICLGSLRPSSSSALKDQVYAWYEFECTEAITCLDARMDSMLGTAPRETQKVSKSNSANLTIQSKAANAKLAQSTRLTPKPLNLVVGGILGTIFVYEDILETLARVAKSKATRFPTPRRFHWHSKLVGSVKWSSDGNYIISGGSETVLVFWQLDTGLTQFLPHLSAAIEHISLSADGSSYGVSLSNNSALALSALNLEPTASIIGIQLPIFASNPRCIQDVKRVANQGLTKLSRRPVAAVSSTSPGRLLLAVPASSISRLESAISQGHTYLQTFDVMADQSVARQALTRNLVTDLPTGPEGNTIIEPDVVLVCVSACGQWLATVDEWGPPRQDVQASVVDDDLTTNSLSIRAEIHLKFWSWNEGTKLWELVSRIDAPHMSAEYRRAGRVLDLAEDPSHPGFATLGENGLVKIWRPRTRYLDGVVIRGKNSKPAKAWACQWSVPSPQPQSSTVNHGRNIGRLTFSADGSLLCVAQQNSKISLIFSIDSSSGQVHSLFPHLIQGSLIGLGLVEKYMIVLSDRLVVWDLVGSRMDERMPAPENRQQDHYSHLAIDQRHGTFAIGTAMAPRLSAQVRVTDAKDLQTLYTIDLPRPLKVLVSNSSRKTYIAVDDMAEARILGPMTALPIVQAIPTQELPHRSAGLEKILETAKQVSVAKKGAIEEELMPEPQSMVIRQHQLAEIFEVGPPFALPPITRLFEQVAALFSRKTAAA